MLSNYKRAEILVGGVVQGVGFRYFMYECATKLNLKGFTRNLSSGEVLTVVEGDKSSIEALYEEAKRGPRHASVQRSSIEWDAAQLEFNTFEITG